MFAYLQQLFNLIRSLVVEVLTRYREACRAAAHARRRLALYNRLRLDGLEDRIVPAPYLWTPVPGSTDYADGANWTNQNNGSTGFVPSTNDTGTIPAGSICVLNSSATIGGLFAQGGGFGLGSGGDLTITTFAGGKFAGGNTFFGTLQADGNVTFSGSGNIVENGAQLGGGGMFNVVGALDFAGAVTVNGNMTVNPGGSGTGTLVDITPSGTASISDWGDFYWEAGTIGVDMTLEATSALQTQTAVTKTLGTGKTITNQSMSTDLGGVGTLDISSGATFDDAWGKVRLSIPIVSPTAATKPYGLFSVDAGATLDVNNTGTTTITSDFTNDGIVDVEAGSTLVLSTLITGPGGPSTITFNGKYQVDGTLTLLGTLGTITSTTGFTQLAGNGTLQIGSSTAVGTLTVDSGATGEIQGTTEVTGKGTLTGGGTVANSKMLIMDVGSSNGTSGIGAYVEANSGTLDLKASGPLPTAYSKLKVAGTAQLSGILELDFVGGYTPAHGTTFTVLTAGAIGAHFDQTPPGMTAHYTSTSVSVTEN